MGNLIKKILIAPNSYKESIDSVSATRLLRDFFTDKLFDLYTLPLSDGGDGFLSVCKEKFNKNDELKAGIDLPYCYDGRTKKVYIESAGLIGMKVIPADMRNPLKLNSAVLGELLLQLKKRVELKEIDIEEVIIGVGGTATMDMGLGVASSFGLKFYDNIGNTLPVVPSQFRNAVKITFPEIKLPFNITAINDVNNTLLGLEGGLKIYGPQKGASKRDIALIEKGIVNLLSLIKNSIGAAQFISGETLPGAGGGLSAGLKLFFNAQMKTSEQFILDEIGLREYIGKVDYVITGEGKFDSQSFYNKAAGLVIKSFPEVPIFLCCGIIDDIELPDNVVPIELSRFFTSLEESIENTPAALELAAGVIKTYINQGIVV